jgi:predicted transcriptional regulator
MSDKDLVLELVQRLPQDSTLQQISREVAFLAGIRAAEEQANRGELIDHERIREELQTWISS